MVVLECGPVGVDQKGAESQKDRRRRKPPGVAPRCLAKLAAFPHYIGSRHKSLHGGGISEIVPFPPDGIELYSKNSAPSHRPFSPANGTRPATLNPQPSTLDPQPSTLNPRLSTLNPQPSTLGPQPLPLDPP